MTWDGACLWLSDASTDRLVYHLDAETGGVLRSFPGPGAPGHQATGVAWDCKNLWAHDEAKGRAAIYQLEIVDITEGGRCAGAFQLESSPDAGPPLDAGPAAVATEAESRESTGCTTSLGRVQASPFGAALGALLGAALARRRRLMSRRNAGCLAGRRASATRALPIAQGRSSR